MDLGGNRGIGARWVHATRAASVILVSACGGSTGGEPASEPADCVDARSIRDQIAAEADKQGVASPCEMADGGYVEPYFAKACEKLEEKRAACCAQTDEWCV